MHTNFFASSSRGKVSLARFKHCRRIRKRLIAGMGNQRLFLSAAAFAARKVVDPDNMQVPSIAAVGTRAEEIGAYESDLTTVYRTRATRLAGWWEACRTYFVLPITEVVMKWVEECKLSFLAMVERPSPWRH